MSTTFEERALSAGAALRTAFELDAAPGVDDRGGPVMTTTATPVSTSPVTPVTPVTPLAPLAPRRGPRRAVAAAGLTAAAVAAGLLVLPGLGDDPDDRLTPTPAAPAGPSVMGAEIALPDGYRVDYRGGRHLLAADPADTATRSLTLLVPATGIEPDASATRLEGDALGWVRQRDGVEVVDEGPITVDGREGVVVLVRPTGGGQLLWCAGSGAEPDRRFCTTTGAYGTPFVVVPFGGESLVLQVASAVEADGVVTDAERAQWVAELRDTAARVSLPD